MTDSPDKAAFFFTYLSDEIVEARHMKPGKTGTDLHLPGTGDLTARIKVYVSGGENLMHSHPREDHSFFILQGQATFHVESDEQMVDVVKNQGILIPRGTKYWFTNTGDENLVLLRVGSSASNAFYRHDANDNEITGAGVFPQVESQRIG